MAIWCCDVEACGKPAVRTEGDCILCNRHLCSQHVQRDFHKCPSWKDGDVYDAPAAVANDKELKALFDKINIRALISRASFLRDGIPCDTVDPFKYDRKSQYTVMGGMNYHIELRFDDDVRWMARIRRFNATSPPPILRDAIMMSEVCTLKFLENLNIPTPKVFDYALESESTVGVGYILTEKMPGEPLNQSSPSADQKRNVISQIADIYIELEKHPFDLMGCFKEPGSLEIGQFAREVLTHYVDDKVHAIGPCTSTNEYLKESVQLVLDLIVREEMYTTRAVDAYLIHLFLLDSVDTICLSQGAADDGRFYLKHADDKGDHILVDDDYNVTAILDWEWAYTAPKSIAFNSPLAFFSVGEFYKGVTTPGEEELLFAQVLEDKGRPELAGIVRNGKIQHHFDFCHGYDFDNDWEGFLGLFKGLRRALGGEGAEYEWEDWKKMALARYSGNEHLEALKSRERV